MRNEWRKIFSKKNSLLIIMVLAVNLFFMILNAYGPGTSVSPEIYREIFDEMDGMTNQEKYEYLKKNSEAEIESAVLSDYEKQSAEREMAESANTIACYERYLSNMEGILENKTKITLFGDANSFSQRNAKKMQGVYASLHGTKVEFGPDRGIELADMTVTNILVLFLIVFLSAESLISEKEEGLLTLLRSCKKGRGWLLGNKMYSLVTGIFLISGLFLLENILFGAVAYGVGNLGRPLQSLPGYQGCPLKISVVSFLLLLWLVRGIALMLVSTFVLVLTVSTYQMVTVLGKCLLVGSISYFLYAAIGLQSDIVFLHYVNPVAMLKAAPLIKGEMNLNLFGFPISPLTVTLAVWSVLYIGLNLWLFRKFNRNQEGQGINLPKRKRIRKKSYIVSVWAGEAYKLVVTRKAALFLLMIFALQVFLYPGRSYIASPNEIYENYCMRALEGEVGEKQEQWLAIEQERLEEDREALQMEQEVMNSTIMPLFEHLKKMKTETGRAKYIVQTGYEKLFGVGNQMVDRKNTILYVLLLLCTVSTYISMEKAGNMTAIIGPTKVGWKNVRRKKQILVVLFSMISMIIVWLPDWIWILKTYDVKYWEAPIKWLFEFRDMKVDFTIGVYFLLLIVVRLLGGAIAGLLMLLISEKSRSGMEAYGINTVVFCVPAVLVVLGVPYVEKVTFSALLDGNVILRMIL